MTLLFKREEIKSHAIDWLKETKAQADDGHTYDFSEVGDVHHDIFNTEYYIIGNYQARQWLGSLAFDVINIIKEYEQDQFGEVYTDFSDPERVVNMYVYIVGEEIMQEAMEEAGVEVEEQPEAQPEAPQKFTEILLEGAERDAYIAKRFGRVAS